MNEVSDEGCRLWLRRDNRRWCYDGSSGVDLEYDNSCGGGPSLGCKSHEKIRILGESNEPQTPWRVYIELAVCLIICARSEKRQGHGHHVSEFNVQNPRIFAH